jgi:uncharacterized protein
MGLPIFAVFLALQLFLLLVGAVWMNLAGYSFVERLDPLRDTVALAVLLGAIWALEQVFSRFFPHSFKATEALHSQVGSLMRQQGMTHHQALVLAMASGLGEEVLFRGAIQNALFGGWMGVGLQAVIFAALHPTPDRKAWVYPVYVFCAGLLFGATYLVTGSLVAGILAHYINNARGFYQLLEAQKSRP